MKSNKDFRTGGDSDAIKKPQKLEPIRKSGKEKHVLYKALDDDDDQELLALHKRESAYDYIDDGEEREEIEDPESDEWEESDPDDEEWDEEQESGEEDPE